MNLKYRKLRTSLCAVSLILLLTACGSDDSFSLSDWGEFLRIEFEEFMSQLGFGKDDSADSSASHNPNNGGYTEPDVEVEIHDSAPSADGNEEMEAPAEGLSGFYYNQLSDDRKSVYDQLYTGIVDRKSEFFIRAQDDEDCGPALNALVCDHPEFFWIDGNASIYGYNGPGAKKIVLEFNIDPEEIESVQASIDAAAQEYLNMLPEGAGTYDKVKAAYEYVIYKADYVLDAPQAQNIQSVFLNGQSVCAGYTRAFQYLLSKVGIYSAYIAGTVEHNGVLESHAWSMVNIDGSNYMVDVTWGDPNYGETDTEGKIPGILYNYLCLTTEDMERSSHIPDPEYSYPICEARDYNYYYLNGYYHDTCDSDTISAVLDMAVENDERSVHFKFADFDTYAEAVYLIFDGGMLNEALQRRMQWDDVRSISYYPMNNDALCTIDIYW